MGKSWCAHRGVASPRGKHLGGRLRETLAGGGPGLSIATFSHHEPSCTCHLAALDSGQALRGVADAVRVLEQTPHSLLWDFDAIAYLMMGLAALFVIPALGDASVERRARLACMAHVAATVLSGIVYFYPTYSQKRLLIGFPWAVTAPLFMLLVGMVVRAREARDDA